MTATATPETAAAPAAAGKPGMSTKVIAMAVAALVVGGALGMFIIAPKLRGGPKSAATTEEHKPEGKTEAPRIVRLDNIIVNPAGTLGQRFLIVSVAIETKSAAAEEKLKNAEIPFRDAVTGLLERMTMPQLTQLGARDSVRIAVATFAKKLAGDTALQVYLPQFLIQ